MGDKCIPWIHEIIDNHPDPIVHALDVMFPGVMRYEGYVPLNEVCEVWSELLTITHDQSPMDKPPQEKCYN